MKVKDLLFENAIYYEGNIYNKSNPVVSVLLPTWKRYEGGHLARAIKSVLNQTFKKLELIIIDDASTDGSFEYIQNIMSTDGRVSCIRHKENIGLPAISEYEGYLRAKGKYIAFIFDDNEWYPDAIQKTISYMEENECFASYGITRLYTDDTFHELGRNIYNISNLYVSNYIGNGAVVLRREVIEEVGLYDPHLALTRLCDWDLWRRIIRKYVFCETGILFNAEHGVSLKDSLGNTHSLDWWAAEEIMQMDRTELLLPKAFANYDVIRCGIYSQHIIGHLKGLRKVHNSKTWWKSVEIELETKHAIPIKRIAVMVREVTMTVSNTFVNYYADRGLVFKIYPINSNSSSLLWSDAMVVVRDLVTPDHTRLLQLTKHYEIPIFYYVDDNFVELKNDGFTGEEIEEIAENTNAAYLSQFTGVLLSTEELQNYFIEKGIHKKCILMEPAMITSPYKLNAVYDNEVVMAFLGGGFRVQSFIDIVLPAIKKLSEYFSIKLVVPDYGELTSVSTEIQEINWVFFSRTLSYELLMSSMQKMKINILLHNGDHIRNNRYKTLGAILNAVQIGAVTVCSNIEPYTTYVDQDLFHTCDNHTEAWRDALHLLMHSEETRERIYGNAVRYCENKYSTKVSANELSSYITPIKYYERNSIFEKLLPKYLPNKDGEGYKNDNTHRNRPHRTINPSKLTWSGWIKKAIAYYILCDTNILSGLDVIFTHEDKHISGAVSLDIFFKGLRLRSAVLDLQNIHKDDWTHFSFPPIYGAALNELEIRFSFQYDEVSARFGIYEDLERVNMYYRMISKISRNSKRLNVLFFDCVE